MNKSETAVALPAVFNFNNLAVRTALIEDTVWFAANDVCAALEFGNPRQAIKTHVDEDDVQFLDTIDSLGRVQEANHVNESGLYALIFGSTKESAKKFKRWVTSEVLPAIRRTGRYQYQAEDAIESEPASQSSSRNPYSQPAQQRNITQFLEWDIDQHAQEVGEQAYLREKDRLRNYALGHLRNGVEFKHIDALLSYSRNSTTRTSARRAFN